MHIIMGVAFGMVVAAPFLGQWRAKVWLKKIAQAEKKIIRFSRPELHDRNI